MGEKNKPREHNAMPGEGKPEACQGGGRNGHPHHCWSQGSSGKFKGKTKEIKLDTFNNTGPHNAAQFNKSLKNIADYLQLNHGNNVSEAVRNLAPVTIIIPPAPMGNVSEVNLYLWKREHNKVQDRKDKYDKNMAKAYIIVYHQCSPTFKNDLKASDTFSAIRGSQDVIALLKLIQSLCCSYDTKMQGVMATVASHKCLFTYYQ
jgi:hypothetical protein